jgi:hypothetical protein
VPLQRPAGHTFVQGAVRPVVLLNVPALHSLHCPSEERPVSLLHFPGVQRVASEIDRPVWSNHFPAGSGVHTSSEERPVLAPYRPALHGLGHLSSDEVKVAIVLLQRPAGHLEAKEMSLVRASEVLPLVS